VREKPDLAPRVSGQVVMVVEVASQKSAPMMKYNTNLVAEFYVLSMLHRLGVDAVLTVGNKKSVDILINSEGFTQTVDVKGVASRYDDWPFGNINLPADNKHFFAFVRSEAGLPIPSTHRRSGSFPPVTWSASSSDSGLAALSLAP
jgi:hypothetical protein